MDPSLAGIRQEGDFMNTFWDSSFLIGVRVVEDDDGATLGWRRWRLLYCDRNTTLHL